MPRKGGTHDRGYGWRHQKERAKWAPKVNTGTITCWRCIANGVPHHQALIKPGQPWDLGHVDGTISTNQPRWRGPEHTHCNRSAGQRKAATNRAPRPQALDFFTPTPPDDPIGA